MSLTEFQSQLIYIFVHILAAVPPIEAKNLQCYKKRMANAVKQILKSAKKVFARILATVPVIITK